jgi:hypothetical protein
MQRTIATGMVAAAVLTGAAWAEASDFLGNWKNPEPGPGGLMHVMISPNGGDRVDLRAYGDCHPNECDWGFVQGRVYTADPKSSDVQVIVATFHFGFAHHQITFHKGPRDRLSFEMLTDFADGSDQHAFAVSGTLEKTVWAGPLAQVWQRQPGLSTGWGGGARDGASPRPIESCTGVDTHGARAIEHNGSWKVMAGGTTLADAGRDDKAAMIAAAAFRHYGFDRRCTVGGPWKAYWKRGDDFARDRIGGPGCIKFDPTTVHLVKSGGAWKIVDGAADVADFGVNQAKAEATLALIRYNKLEALCSVRWPDPIMMFWVAHSELPP